MKPKNVARGIRLRKENIQIGDEEICKKFFTKTEDQRFSFYYFGEIYAVSKDLIPNSRRDYFGENTECRKFEQSIKKDFLKLKETCYDAQKIRTSSNTIAKGEELRQKIKEKEKYGYTSQEERENLQKQIEDQKKKENQARRQLANVQKKIENSNSPLRGILDKLKPEQNNLEVRQNVQPKEDFQQHKIKFRTDKDIYSGYSKKEKKLIGKIYTAITNAIPEEEKREALISKIEEEITK